MSRCYSTQTFRLIHLFMKAQVICKPGNNAVTFHNSKCLLLFKESIDERECIDLISHEEDGAPRRDLKILFFYCILSPSLLLVVFMLHPPGCE